MENYKVILTESADEDTGHIIDYLKEYSLSAADQFLQDLEAAYQRLKTFPLMGPEAREWELRRNHYRKLVIGDYVTLYRIVDDTCVIDHIFHGRQDYQSKYIK